MQDEDKARLIARICGGSSAAAKAVAELDARRQKGEDVQIWYIGGVRWIVGPPLPDMD